MKFTSVFKKVQKRYIRFFAELPGAIRPQPPLPLFTHNLLS